MTALISAELLRIRTLRATRYVVVGMLGLAVLLAVFPPSGPRSALVDSVRSVTFIFVMAAAYIAATQLGTEFKRGTVALTYLAHPNRRTVATARVLTYGVIGGLLAALAAVVALAAGVVAAHFAATPTDIGAQAIARVIGGAAFGGAALGGFGKRSSALSPANPPSPGGGCAHGVDRSAAARCQPLPSLRTRRSTARRCRQGRRPRSDDPAARLSGHRRPGRPPMGAPTRPFVSNSVSPRLASSALPLETSALRRSYGRLVALQGPESRGRGRGLRRADRGQRERQDDRGARDRGPA